MYEVEMYLRLRRACMVEGMSVREASRVFGLHRDTVRKMLEYSVPPGYRRESPPRKPKLEPESTEPRGGGLERGMTGMETRSSERISGGWRR